jgi:hypothetical protein
MKQTDQQADEAFRDQCRAWCEANLPEYLGFKRAV